MVFPGIPNRSKDPGVESSPGSITPQTLLPNYRHRGRGPELLDDCSSRVQDPLQRDRLTVQQTIRWCFCVRSDAQTGTRAEHSILDFCQPSTSSVLTGGLNVPPCTGRDPPPLDALGRAKGISMDSGMVVSAAFVPAFHTALLPQTSLFVRLNQAHSVGFRFWHSRKPSGKESR